MIYLHCQVRFSDYSKWKACMDADAFAQTTSIYLKHLWRGINDPVTAFFC